MSKVLVVEDYPGWGVLHTAFLENFGYTGVVATTLREAERFFKDGAKEFVGVILDACIEEPLDTLPLLYWMRGTMRFEGPIVAASSDDDYSHKLVEAGCNASAPGKKPAAEILHRLLTT